MTGGNLTDLLPKPMKGDEPEHGEKLALPLWFTWKMDGIRTMLHPHPNKTVKDALPMSASLKPIKNKHIAAKLAKLPPGMDAEIAVVNPETKAVDFLATTSAVMRSEGTPEFKLYIFDYWNAPGGYLERVEALKKLVLPDWCEILIPVEVKTQEELDALFLEARALGHEGLIGRKKDGKYKHGRSTVREALMVKVKPWKDGEAIVEGVYEEMHNGNEAETSELGRTKRSSAKAGKTGKGRCGGFIMRDPKRWGGKTFRATGLTDKQKEHYWQPENNPKGELWKYKWLDTGGKDLPRHPGLLGPRDKDDITEY